MSSSVPPPFARAGPAQQHAAHRDVLLPSSRLPEDEVDGARRNPGAKQSRWPEPELARECLGVLDERRPGPAYVTCPPGRPVSQSGRRIDDWLYNVIFVKH